MSRSVDSHEQQNPVRKRIKPVEAEISQGTGVGLERAPDVEGLVQESLQSSFGNTIVQAALRGADVGGLGDVIASEIAATSMGMGALSDEGQGLLAAGNAAVQDAARKAQGDRLTQHDAMNALRGGGGQQLPTGVRTRMEAVFGRSFAGVRVHTDTAEAADALGAEAVAMGSHLHFAEGAYDPGSSSGQAVIAHELTHVVQAQDGRLPGVGGVSSTSMAAEREAYANESLAGLPGLDVDGPSAGTVQLASDVDTSIAPSALGSSGLDASVGASFGLGGFGSGFGASSMAPLAGASVDGGIVGAEGPVRAATSAPAMLRETDDIDREESDTEASARHEVAMGLDQGFRRSLDMSQGDQTVNVSKEGTGRKDGIFTGPAANGHLAVDEYNSVMRDIGPDGDSRASGGDENTPDSAQNTQTENDGHVHLDGSPKLGATPETTATAPGGDPVMGGSTGGMVAGTDKAAGPMSDSVDGQQSDVPPGHSQQKGPMENDLLNTALAGAFGQDITKLSAGVDDAANKAIGARAFTQNTGMTFRSDIATDDLTDHAAMQTVGHEVAHALAGGGTSQSAVDQEGDAGEKTAADAGAKFADFVAGGMRGPAPRLTPAVGGKAKRHRETDEDSEDTSKEEPAEDRTENEVVHDEFRSVKVDDDRITASQTVHHDGMTDGAELELSGDGVTITSTQGVEGQGTATDGVTFNSDGVGYQTGMRDAEGNQTTNTFGYDANKGAYYQYNQENADKTGMSGGVQFDGETAGANYTYTGQNGSLGGELTYGPDGYTVGGNGSIKYGDTKVGGNIGWSNQRDTSLQTEGEHFTALGNVIDSIGPVGQASETDTFNWGVDVEGKVRGVGLGASVSGENADTSSFYSAVDNFPVPGLTGDMSDPANRAARDAYIKENPEEFDKWMGERREAVLGDADTLSEFDWQNLSAGEAVSFNESDKLGGEVSAGYAGIGVKIGGESQDVHEVTMAMREEGMLDIAVTAMDKGTATAGMSAFGAVEIDGSRTDGDISQVKFTIDTKTEAGQQQASLFNQYGVLPGALDSLPAEVRDQFEQGLAADETGMCLMDPPDMAAIAAQANDAFMKSNKEGDLPTPGSTTYENIETGEIEGGGANLKVAGLDLLQSNYETVMTENRYRNEAGLTETEHGFTHESDVQALDIPLVGWSIGEDKHVESFALANPEFNEDVALFAGISGDYKDAPEVKDGETAAMTVTMTDEQMAGMADYLKEIGGSEEALFNESAADYFFNGVEHHYGMPMARPGEDSYVGHDGEKYSYQGPGGDTGLPNMMDANARAYMTGLNGTQFDSQVLASMPEFQRERILEAQQNYGDDRSLSNLSALAFGDDSVYQAGREQLLNQMDETMKGVQSVDDFKALDPQMQSLYIQNSAIRLSYEEKNPMMAMSLAFELEDADQRNEVMRDVLAHLPEAGTQYMADLVEEARASNPELADLLEGVVQEGAIRK